VDLVIVVVVVVVVVVDIPKEEWGANEAEG